MLWFAVPSVDRPTTIYRPTSWRWWRHLFIGGNLYQLREFREGFSFWVAFLLLLVVLFEGFSSASASLPKSMSSLTPFAPFFSSLSCILGYLFAFDFGLCLLHQVCIQIAKTVGWYSLRCPQEPRINGDNYRTNYETRMQLLWHFHLNLPMYMYQKLDIGHAARILVFNKIWEEQHAWKDRYTNKLNKALQNECFFSLFRRAIHIELFRNKFRYALMVVI